MTDIQIRDYFDVDLVDGMGSDSSICRAARVSTIGAASLDSDADAGLIGYLMRNRHGSPFEHGAMTFRITCPIFVWREFMRHRIGFSYNEESGRYKMLDGVFYIPAWQHYNKDSIQWVPGRPMVQVGKNGHYQFERGPKELWEDSRVQLTESYERSWAAYQLQLELGVAKEVARMCLPVATYSTAYVTCNPRSLMAFLSLRRDDERAAYPSKPQWEIEQVARNMEEHFAELFPLTLDAFNMAGRVSP